MPSPNKMRKLILSLAAAVLLAGCEKEKITDNNGVNRWVHATLESEYLWSSELGEYSPSSLAPDKYFKTVRYRSNRTVDYEDDYYGDRFSAVTRKDAGARSAEMLDAGDNANDFGFVTMMYTSESTGDVVYGQIIYVVPGSPADRAGIKRGYNYNAMEVGPAVYETPLSVSDFATALSNRTVTFHFFYPESKAVKITRASYEDNPVIFDSIYDTDQGKTAYLVYNHFTSGANDKFNNDLKKVFARFKREGVENLILDLRYNGGGELKAAVLLASLIARTGDLGKTFAYLERNKHKGQNFDRYDMQRFYSLSAVGAENNLNVRQLYIITLEYTASASELVLHCLKPYFGDDLKHVGKKTYGKNVGSKEITNGSYDWIIRPITLRAYNKNGVSGYEEGIPVSTYRTGEESYVYGNSGLGFSSYSVIGDFGELENTPEIMLQKVVNHINTGLWPVSVRSADGPDERDAIYKKSAPGIRERGLTEEGVTVF